MAKSPIPSRYAVFILCILLIPVAAGLALAGHWWGWPAAAVLAALVLVGLWDLSQPRHSILRNYPGHRPHPLDGWRWCGRRSAST